MSKNQIGVIGLAVMGKNLALNIENKGFSVSLYNRSRSKTCHLLEEAKGKNLTGSFSIEEFVNSLEKPRKILMMVRAGKPVDETIERLKPFLSKGDIIIDGGNSFFKDTIRRCKQLESEGIMFIGAGVSGGEEGALKGPAIMPGGQKTAYNQVAPILNAISAKVEGDSCCTYIDEDGSGHFVKMVHNGIEYSDMQLIGEAFFLLKNILNLSYEELYNIFDEWNKGELDSYLIEITRDIFSKIDPDTGKPMLDIILDKTGQKGTGKWTSQISLDLGIPTPTIAEAVYARCISVLKQERIISSKILKGPLKSSFNGNTKEFIESIRKALYASKICSYAQGFSMMRASAVEYGWNLNFGKIAMIFRGGCIIRARFLNKIKDAYDTNQKLENLMIDAYFSNILENYQEDWRKVVTTSVSLGVPTPSFSSAIAYYDSYRSESLPANLLQAQRDYFGAHTFERKDKEGKFHFQWF